MSRNEAYGTFRVRSDVYTRFCKQCGALIADPYAHTAWHKQEADDA